MITIRKLNRVTWIVLRDGEERARFTGKLAEAKARAWAEQRYAKSPTDVDVVLFQSCAQTVCWLTDAGDNTEPKEFCPDSLVRLCDDTGRAMIMTVEEALSLFGWRNYLANKLKQ